MHTGVTSRQEKAQLRAMVHDAVLRHTQQRRQMLWERLTKEHQDWDQDRVQREVDILQPEYQEFDPVVEMAVFASDHSNAPELRLRAMSESAQYLRPKLKSVEVDLSALTPEEQAAREQLSGTLAGLLDLMAEGKRATIDVTPNARGAPSPAPQPRSGSSVQDTVGDDDKSSA
jgi:hypothetical protein